VTVELRGDSRMQVVRVWQRSQGETDRSGNAIGHNRTLVASA